MIVQAKAGGGFSPEQMDLTGTSRNREAGRKVFADSPGMV